MLASYGLQYDDNSNTVGNLTRVTESDGSQANYGYDELYRLTSETRTGTAPVSHAYEYDLAGNRKTYDGVSATFDAANKQNGQTYDGDGNFTNSGTLTWDDNNKITTRPGETYQYSAIGLLASTTVGSNKNFHIYDGELLIGEVQNTNSIVASYTWGADGIVSERLPQFNKSRWYHFGPQGETRLLTDEIGAIADSYTYSAQGVLLNSSGVDQNQFRYGGKLGYYSNLNSNLILCGARWYDPTNGRWLSRDPSGYKGGSNLYKYCEDNPLNLIDPDGLDPASPNPVDCNKLMGEIMQLAWEIDDRAEKMLTDNLLPKDQQLYPLRNGPNKGLNPNRRDHTTWNGHGEQMENKQTRLRNKIQEWDDSPCGGPGGSLHLQQWVRDIAYLPVPTQPRPIKFEAGAKDETAELLLPLFLPGGAVVGMGERALGVLGVLGRSVIGRITVNTGRRLVFTH